MEVNLNQKVLFNPAMGKSKVAIGCLLTSSFSYGPTRGVPKHTQVWVGLDTPLAGCGAQGAKRLLVPQKTLAV